MEDDSNSDDEDFNDGGEPDANEEELEISGLSGMSGDLLGDNEMEVSDLEEPEQMETGVRWLEEPVQVPVEVEREVDIREERKLTDFLQAGCGCPDSCWKNFDPSYLRATRTSLLELSSHELDMVLMGQIMAGTYCGESTSSNKRNTRERQRNFTTFSHGGMKVSHFLKMK